MAEEAYNSDDEEVYAISPTKKKIEDAMSAELLVAIPTGTGRLRSLGFLSKQKVSLLSIKGKKYNQVHYVVN